MNAVDMTEIRYSVTEHRHRLRSEVSAGHEMQKRWVAYFGSFLAWNGMRLIRWGRALQATAPKVQLQNILN